ncbi:MAG: hypothetical protein ACTSWW_01250 [Promethearchaeota archaeon]
MINMKRAVIIGFMCTILLASSIAPIRAEDSYSEGIKTTQVFTYGAEVGDEYIFNFLFNVSAGFENASVYDEIWDWANDTIPVEEMTELTDMAAMVEDYFELINQDFQVKLGVTQKYSEWRNESYWDGSEYDEYDMFNASLRMREAGDEDWLMPTDFAIDKVGEVSDFAINSLGVDADDIYLEYAVGNATEVINESELYVDYNDMEIQRIHTISDEYYENGTLDENEWPSGAPQLPLDFYGPEGPVFFKPEEFLFDEWLTFAEEFANWGIAQANGSVPYESFDQAIAYAGITTLEANPNGFAIVFNTAAVDYTHLESWSGMNFDPADPDAEIPISDFEAQVHLAIEYDNNGILADYVVYYDFSALVSTMELITNGTDAPYLDDERFHVYIIASVYKDGYSIATPDQIAAAEVGDERNLADNLFGALGDIPGYPIGAVSLLALVSVAGLMLKNKRK